MAVRGRVWCGQAGSFVGLAYAHSWLMFSTTVLPPPFT